MGMTVLNCCGLCAADMRQHQVTFATAVIGAH